MKEKLYTIPINDAFAMDSECPICAMKTILENNAVEFTMVLATWRMISAWRQIEWDFVRHT